MTEKEKTINLNLLSHYDEKIKDYIDEKTSSGGVTVDYELSDISENPVQNKVISAALSGYLPLTANEFTGNSSTATKLVSSSATTINIATTDWTTNSSGGYMYTYTLSNPVSYTNFNFDVILSTDPSAAKLQLEAWGCVVSDGMITQTNSNGTTTAFTFYSFTNKPSVELTIAVQGVS